MNAIQKEANEVEIARQFLRNIGYADAYVRSLSEFAGKNLSSKSPDVVAALDNKRISMELTAYSYDDSVNRWVSFMKGVSEKASRMTSDYPELEGIRVTYSPRLINEPHKKDEALFAREILEFVRSRLRQRPLASNERRNFPCPGDLFDQQPFANWDLLEKHVSAIKVQKVYIRDGCPVGITRPPFSNHRSLVADLLVNIVNKKADLLRRNRFAKLDEYWLLIHGTGDPISSRIIPIEPGSGADEKLREPRLTDAAQDSGFDRIYVWNGVHHGFAELTGR